MTLWRRNWARRGDALDVVAPGRHPPCEGRLDDKNHTVGAVFFLHTLMIADLMIAFEIATRATDGVVRLMEPDEILARAPETTRRAANPWKLTAAIVDATAARHARPRAVVEARIERFMQGG